MMPNDRDRERAELDFYKRAKVLEKNNGISGDVSAKLMSEYKLDIGASQLIAGGDIPREAPAAIQYKPDQKLSIEEREKPYVYQAHGPQDTFYWSAGRLYGVSGQSILTKIDGLTKREAECVATALNNAGLATTDKQA